MYAHPGKMRAKASDLIAKAGYERPHHAHGGHADFAADEKMIKTAIREHENQEHGGKHSRISFKDGGHAEGGMAPARLDRKARGGQSGGKKTHGTQVNIAVVPHAGQPGMGGPSGMGAAPMMPPHPPMAPPVAAAPPVPPRPMPPRPMPPPGMGAPSPGMPPGGMGMPGGMQPRPMGIKTGGRAHRADGGSMGRGGVGEPRFSAGSGGGRGRLEKKDREGAERWGDGK